MSQPLTLYCPWVLPLPLPDDARVRRRPGGAGADGASPAAVPSGPGTVVSGGTMPVKATRAATPARTEAPAAVHGPCRVPKRKPRDTQRRVPRSKTAGKRQANPFGYQAGPAPGRGHPGVWQVLPGGPAGRLAASHLRGPRLTTTQLDHLLSSVCQLYPHRSRSGGEHVVARELLRSLRPDVWSDRAPPASASSLAATGPGPAGPRRSRRGRPVRARAARRSAPCEPSPCCGRRNSRPPPAVRDAPGRGTGRATGGGQPAPRRRGRRPQPVRGAPSHPTWSHPWHPIWCLRQCPISHHRWNGHRPGQVLRCGPDRAGHRGPAWGTGCRLA